MELRAMYESRSPDVSKFLRKSLQLRLTEVLLYVSIFIFLWEMKEIELKAYTKY
jgi:hypothetical protein